MEYAKIETDELLKALEIAENDLRDRVAKLNCEHTLTTTCGWCKDRRNAAAILCAHRARLERKRAVVEQAIEGLAALLPNPKSPDWMPALGASNPADAVCLQEAWDALHRLPSCYQYRALVSEPGERKEGEK